MAASSPAIVARPLLRGWSHLLACLAAIALAPILIVASAGGRLVAALYAAAVIGVFGISGVYHRILWQTRFRSLMRRLDHSMIFVFIAATYTPFAAFVLEGTAALFILIAVWAGAAGGVALRLGWPGAPRWLNVLVYLTVGWAAVAIIDDAWRLFGIAAFTLVLVGGFLYTLGAAVYATKWPNPWPRWFGYHEIFHLLVILAVAVHYVAVAFFALPRAA